MPPSRDQEQSPTCCLVPAEVLAEPTQHLPALLCQEDLADRVSIAWGLAGPSPPIPRTASTQCPFPACSKRFRSNLQTNCAGDYPVPDLPTALRLRLSASNSRGSSAYNLQSQGSPGSPVIVQGQKRYGKDEMCL